MLPNDVALSLCELPWCAANQPPSLEHLGLIELTNDLEPASTTACLPPHLAVDLENRLFSRLLPSGCRWGLDRWPEYGVATGLLPHIGDSIITPAADPPDPYSTVALRGPSSKFNWVGGVWWLHTPG